ncbi:DUF2226 domain-containing protein [Methanothermobacter thermautotrophicus]|uniref:DUF2226 domain-containing protein n=1 Tax=Methanothermobacter thermautotrophicus TaxID=145262 RepID=UPI003D7FBF09
MELPITKPSKISYGDEIDFTELLEKLARDEYNGFIRVTHASDEGYILFRDGSHVAASYGRFMKGEALDRIMEVADKTDTLIELFDLKRSQLDYLMDINKIYRIEETLDEITEIPEVEEESYFNPQEASYRQPATPPEPEPENEGHDDVKVHEGPLNSTVDVPGEVKDQEVTSDIDVSAGADAGGSASDLTGDTLMEEAPSTESSEVSQGHEVSSEEIETPEDLESLEESEEPRKPLSRDELMKKYGLRDIGEEEVERVLETYKGGAITDIDPERVELTLMNKIKMSILGIPKIRGAEVIVFLDNAYDLRGKIKIMVEHEGKGLFSRIMGDSKEEDKLKFHIMDIVEMELRKTFRDFPEIVDNFEVSIEIR